MDDEDFPYDSFVKIFQEPDQENLCIPLCIKMVLETVRQKVEGIPTLSIDRISQIIGTQSDGTPLGDNIEKINDRLKSTRPSMKFYIDYYVSWKSICDDVNQEDPFKKPVIMGIYQYDIKQLNYFPHGVVLLRADNANVTFFDPIYGEMFEPTPKFYNQWEQTERTCIRFKTVPLSQRILEEFPLKNGGVEVG